MVPIVPESVIQVIWVISPLPPVSETIVFPMYLFRSYGVAPLLFMRVGMMEEKGVTKIAIRRDIVEPVWRVRFLEEVLNRVGYTMTRFL
jgi:hypothetical protein